VFYIAILVHMSAQDWKNIFKAFILIGTTLVNVAIKILN
jgi:hypothetical protein